MDTIDMHDHKKAPLDPELKNTFIIAASIIVAGALVAGAILYNGNRASPDGNPVAGAAPTTMPADVSKVKTDGEPFIGKVDAPVTIAYWTDYQCPFCQRNELEVMPQIIQNYVDTGKAKIVFKDFAFLGPDSITLGEYSRAVWATDPGKFYAWHKEVFTEQGKEGTGWATKALIDSITTKTLSAAETSKVDALVAANKTSYDAEMAADKAEGTAQGVSGTPAFVIGKELVVGAQPYSAIEASIKDALK